MNLNIHNKISHYLIQINDTYLKLDSDLDDALTTYNLIFLTPGFVDADGHDMNTILNLWGLPIDGRDAILLRQAFIGDS